MFGIKWKLSTDNDEAFDKDTLPTRKNIKEKLSLIEAESLSFLVDKLG